MRTRSELLNEHTTWNINITISQELKIRDELLLGAQLSSRCFLMKAQLYCKKMLQMNHSKYFLSLATAFFPSFWQSFNSVMGKGAHLMRPSTNQAIYWGLHVEINC